MANSNRRMPDSNDKFFFPKTIDGSTSDPGFITGTKFGIIIAIIMVNFAIFASLSNGIDSGFMIAVKMGFLMFISQLIIRYAVLNEKYYFNMYLRMKETEDTTPATFWRIVDRQDKQNGCVVTFDDTRVGVYVKLERDSIIGKNEEFREDHYDALSDLYKDLNKAGFKYVCLNIMETAGKDPRIPELDNIVVKSEFNKNLCRLMGEQVGYIKNITRVTNYESEYMIIYSDDIDMGSEIIDKVEDLLYVLTNGAYSGYYIMQSDEIDALVKEVYDVTMFDSSLATLSIYDKSNAVLSKPFKIKALLHEDGRLEKYYTEEEKAILEKNKLKEQHNSSKQKAIKGNKGKEKFKGHKESNIDLTNNIENSDNIKIEEESKEEVKKEVIKNDGKIERVASLETILKNVCGDEIDIDGISEQDEFTGFSSEYFMCDDEEEIEL